MSKHELPTPIGDAIRELSRTLRHHTQGLADIPVNKITLHPEVFQRLVEETLVLPSNTAVGINCIAIGTVRVGRATASQEKDDQA